KPDGTNVWDAEGEFDGTAFNVEYTAGRVGRWSALFNCTNSYIRIPAAGSDLELAGSTYSIVWWMKLFEAAEQQVYWMGDDAPDGYGGYGFSVRPNNTSQVMHNGGDRAQT